MQFTKNKTGPGLFWNQQVPLKYNLQKNSIIAKWHMYLVWTWVAAFFEKSNVYEENQTHIYVNLMNEVETEFLKSLTEQTSALTGYKK